jgi:hypothetical protein
VGYFANHQLRKVALEGGESVTLCDAPRDRGGTWTEDGKIIAALSASGELSSVPASGGAPTPFSDMKGESPGVTSHSRPVVLPDGKGVLFIAGAGVATGSLRGFRSVVVQRKHWSRIRLPDDTLRLGTRCSTKRKHVRRTP